MSVLPENISKLLSKKMATLNAVIVPAKALKGGRHKIRISVAHNGETRYIVTDIIINSAKEFKNGNIVKRPDAAILNTKLRGILQRYQNTIDELQYVNGLSCAELVYQIKHEGERKHRTLKSIYDEVMETSAAKPSTLKNYRSIWNIITQSVNPNLLIENMTHNTVLKLDKYLRDKKLTPTSIKNYMVFFRILINHAKKYGYVQFRVDPFVGYKMPDAEIRQAWLSVEEIKRIRDLSGVKKNISKCRDLFMLSYYLGGINMADLTKINFKEQTHYIRYIRTKTETRKKSNKYVEFVIPDEAKGIISHYTGDDGYLKLSSYQKRSLCKFFFTTNLPKLAKAVNVDYLIYYSARKSFAQHAFDIGIRDSVIDYILGHKVDKGESTLYNYISVTPAMATEAIRKVLDNLK